MGGLIIGIILILVGISALTGISVFSFIVAIVLIAIGIRMIVRHSSRGTWHWDDHNHSHDYHHGFRTTSDEDRIDEVAVFSPLDKSFTSQHFRGGKIVMVFSGGEIDLTRVKTDGPEINLEVSSVFSGVRITIPKDWKVRTSTAAFLGGVDVHQAKSGDGGSGSVTLNLRGEAAFGGIEVRK